MLLTPASVCAPAEVVLVTREPKLKIFKFRGNAASTVGQSQQSFQTLYAQRGVDWDQLVLVREVGLLSSLAITSGRQIVGLSSGYIRPYSRTRNRKQVIVLVNEGWGIFVFNYKLRLMWTRAIEADLALRYLAEVAIMIDPHPMRRASPGGAGAAGRNDTGVIVVGGRLALKSSLHRGAYGLHVDTAAPGEQGPRPLEFPADFAEALQGRILRPGRKRGSVTSDDVRDREADHTETLSKDPLHFERAAHFSYYAFEGLSGDTRWRHDSESFLEESAASDLMRPQHEALHSGEMDWRVFRQAILDAALPHAWEGGRAATWIDIAHVEKTRTGHQRQAIKKKRQTKSNFFVKDAFGLRPHRDTEHVLNPNALVVHLRDGLEILHLYSGRPLCRLTLKAGEVHVDMDGDGVIDHVEAIGGLHQAAARARSGGPEHSLTLPKCLAVVHSGIPASRQLFNASICQSSWSDLMRFGGGNLLRSMEGAAPEAAHNAAADASLSASIGSAPVLSGARGGSNSFSLEGGIDSSSEDGSTESRSSRVLSAILQGGQAEMQQQVQVAHPIVIQEPRTTGKRAKKRRFHSFFFLNSGLVSSFNHDGTRTWHTMTKAHWNSAAAAALSPLAAAFRPTLSAFSLRVDTPADHVLVIGERSAALLSLGGHLRADHVLAADTVVAKPVVGDFNNDGISDFVVITTKGSAQHTRKGGAAERERRACC